MSLKHTTLWFLAKNYLEQNHVEFYSKLNSTGKLEPFLEEVAEVGNSEYGKIEQTKGEYVARQESREYMYRFIDSKTTI